MVFSRYVNKRDKFKWALTFSGTGDYDEKYDKEIHQRKDVIC